ncbi:hypothetical protein [Streptomyces sp. N35]|uniref:hypothetical protein n=1 Tax=Streptomyces sp. N35 TaxID=2795730 RepID=UPI0018F385BF|nr:hypothetical protein [Streptomyces sp. N35]
MIDIDEFTRGARPAIRSLIEVYAGGEAAAAFDVDPRSAVDALDEYVMRLPIRELETDDWITLHSDLIAFVTVVLQEIYGATCRARLDDALPTGWEFVIDVVGEDGQQRTIVPWTLVLEHLRPVPQRIPRLLEAVERAAGHGAG